MSKASNYNRRKAAYAKGFKDGQASVGGASQPVGTVDANYFHLLQEGHSLVVAPMNFMPTGERVSLYAAPSVAADNEKITDPSSNTATSLRAATS